MLKDEVKYRHAEIDRVILQGGKAENELQKYRAVMLALDDFEHGGNEHVAG
ncbi:MAG: hypothetical protein SO072_02690 [Dysosmobacter sp.]|nr:hypothetical protein [Dysosmobacter sp.]